MSSPNIPSIPQYRLSEREWDKLITVIIEGHVVPVVGPEFLTTQHEGREEFLYTVWGRILAEQAGLTAPSEDEVSALYQVTNRLSVGQNSNDLALDIDEVIRRRAWTLSGSLRKLAEIMSFRLYITTTIDHLLTAALQEARPDQRSELQEIVFRPRGKQADIDLPEDFDFSPPPTVFHLFGATSSLEGTFAKTEDDLIEFSWCLLDKQYAPERLYDYLQKKTVLLLGCSFPDWLGRFFIHALNAGRHEETINIYYISSRHQEGLEDYLRRKRAKVLVPQSPLAFIEELHKRWQSRIGSQASPYPAAAQSRSAPSALKPGAVFLSYGNEDRAIVQQIRAQLEAAQVDTWMDESGLEPGVEYEQVIHENIRNASFFLAIISRSLDSAGKAKRYLWKEWKWAEDQNLERRKEHRFLQPVVIDDTPRGAKFIDDPYRSLQWTALLGSRLPDEFIQLLKQGVRRFRKVK
jgi:hypothetical protein